VLVVFSLFASLYPDAAYPREQEETYPWHVNTTKLPPDLPPTSSPPPPPPPPPIHQFLFLFMTESLVKKTSSTIVDERRKRTSLESLGHSILPLNQTKSSKSECVNHKPSDLKDERKES